MRSMLEAEKGKLRDLEDLLQVLRAKEHAAVNAEQAAASDSVGLHQRLQAALNENDKNVQVSSFSPHYSFMRFPVCRKYVSMGHTSAWRC